MFDLSRFSLVAAALSAGFLFSASADVFYCFDEEQDSTHAVDSGGQQIHMPYMGSASRTTDAAKFGEGSMALGEDDLKGLGGQLNVFNGTQELGKEITKMTVSLWLLPGDGTQPAFLLQRLNTGGVGGFQFHYTSPGVLLFFVQRSDGGEGGAKVYSNRFPPLQQEEWVHVAMTYADGNVTFYLNGQSLGEAQPVPSGTTSIQDISDSRVAVLRSMVSSHGIRNMDDFAIFTDKALSDEEIQKLCERGVKAYLESR